MDMEPTFFSRKLIRILNVNCEGLGKRRKQLALGEVLQALKIGVCVATESHLRKEDLGRIDIPGYAIVGNFCRKGLDMRIRGGVLILAQTTLTVDNVYDGQGDGIPIESCAVDLRPTQDPRDAIRITGVYISPNNTKNATLRMLQDCRAAVQGGKRSGDGKQTHLLIGDFNPPSWEELMMEWCGEDGLWELTNPNIPTHNAGNALDRILLMVGESIPDTFLPNDPH